MLQSRHALLLLLTSTTIAFVLLKQPLLSSLSNAVAVHACRDSCDCFAEYRNDRIEYMVECEMPHVCLDDQYCGAVSANVTGHGQLSVLRQHNAPWTADIEACVDIQEGFPMVVQKTMNFMSIHVPEICLTAIGSKTTDGLQLNSCQAFVGQGLACECELCESGDSIRFDCSETDLSSLHLPANLHIPKIDRCIPLKLP